MKKSNTKFFLLPVVLVFLTGILFLNLYQSKEFQNKLGNNLNNRDALHYVHKNTRQVVISKHYLGARDEVAAPRVSVGSQNLEDSSANLVTSIVVHYRGFDTLAELTILFTALTSIQYLLRRRKKRKLVVADSFIVTTIVPLVFALSLLIGGYIIIHGHLTPGGGFPGGVVIASGFVLMLMVFPEMKGNLWLKMLESLAGIGFVVVGLMGLSSQGSFLANFLPGGTLGNLFSAGITPIIYILIGIKVASEVSSLVVKFRSVDDGNN